MSSPQSPTPIRRTVLALVATAALVTGACATTSTAAPPQPTLEERWGIDILGVQQASAGYMLDFRFLVLDPDKAAPLFDRATKPYLLDETSGMRFGVPNPPKVGPLRTTYPPKEGRRYFIFFANPGRFVKPGQKVTVVVGDFVAPDLVVE